MVREPVVVRIAAVLGMNMEVKIPGAGWCACPDGGERVRTSISLCVYVRGWVGPRKRRSDSGLGFVRLRFCSGGGAP